MPHTYLVESERSRWLVVTARGNHERFVRQRDALVAAGREHGLDVVGPPLR